MAKEWGIARFYGMGSMEYLMETGQWLPDRKLFDGAPLLLFETLHEADAYAVPLNQDSQPHGVQFSLDAAGKVLTARKKTVAKPIRSAANGRRMKF